MTAAHTEAEPECHLSPLPPSDPNVLIRILAGCTTGAMAVSFAQPTDVVKVRFQAQMNLNGVARRYSGTMQAYKHIYRNEGFRGLWKGAAGERLSPELCPINTAAASRLSCGFSRHAAQHHQERTGQLHGARDLRHDQGGHPEAQTHVRCDTQTHPHISIFVGAFMNKIPDSEPNPNNQPLKADSDLNLKTLKQQRGPTLVVEYFAIRCAVNVRTDTPSH